MEYQAEILAKALFLATQNKTIEEKTKIAENLLKFLRQKKKIYLLPEILNSYRKYLERKKGILIFSRKFSKEILEKVRKTFKEILSESKSVQIKFDKGIIGGFILKTENFLIDASIKGYLKKISQSLKKI